MKKYNALGFSKAVWDELPKETEIRIKDEEDGRVYTVSYEDADLVKIADQAEGYELQYFIPLDIFTWKTN